jgi:hypothetical protein
MDRSLRAIAVLGPLALLAACFQIAPRSSVPFQAAAERQSRYAAEIMLAVKEDRRGEASEAVANGRMVLPQLPEIWGFPGAEARAARAERAALEPARTPLEPGVPTGCASLRSVTPGEAALADCGQGGPIQALILPPLGYASIAPAAAPLDP